MLTLIGVLAALVVLGVGWRVFTDRAVRRADHMRPLNYHDDRDGWTRFGQAIDKEPRP